MGSMGPLPLYLGILDGDLDELRAEDRSGEPEGEGLWPCLVAAGGNCPGIPGEEGSTEGVSAEPQASPRERSSQEAGFPAGRRPQASWPEADLVAGGRPLGSWPKGVSPEGPCCVAPNVPGGGGGGNIMPSEHACPL